MANIKQLPKVETKVERFLETTWKVVYLDSVLVDERYRVTLFEKKAYDFHSAIQITSCLMVEDLESGKTGNLEYPIPYTFGASRFDKHLGRKVFDVRVDGSAIVVETRFGVCEATHRVTLE
ncbi:hypothetical protein HYT05_00650 [Candidatus Kaiserbacteria bacterium]|nr:hypothetical protein [Candidatus Kaiserbacteria bacterium]